MYDNSDFEKLKQDVSTIKYNEVKTVVVEEMFMDLNMYYTQNSIPFDDFYYEYNDKLMIYILDNIGFYDATIAASRTDDYARVFSHVMNGATKFNTAETLLHILSEQSPGEFEKYQAALLDKILSEDLNGNSYVVSPLGVLSSLFIYIYGKRECYESDIKIVNSAIGYSIIDDFIKDVSQQYQYPDFIRRLMNALPDTDEYNLYRLGVSI